MTFVHHCTKGLISEYLFSTFFNFFFSIGSDFFGTSGSVFCCAVRLNASNLVSTATVCSIYLQSKYNNKQYLFMSFFYEGIQHFLRYINSGRNQHKFLNFQGPMVDWNTHSTSVSPYA